MIGTVRPSGNANRAATLTRLPWIGPRLAIRLHRSGFGAPPLTWEELTEAVEAERPPALSVDVFDTSLVRDLVGDRAVELAIDHQTAVAASAAAAPPSDPAVGSTPPPSRAAVADEVELRLCRAVPGVADALGRIRRAGTSVTFVSDTERSSVGLEHILRQAKLFVDGDRLVVSNEEGATKSDGDLFHADWRTDASWHVGNCRWADLTMANKAGLRAHPIDRAEPTRYELAMAARPGTAGPAVAGAARSVRLAALDSGPGGAASRASRLQVLGAEVAGQSFGAFLLWLAQECRDNGIDQLQFLSRDGELLWRMAEAMPADHWSGVSLGYLHCSRWSWFLAGATSYGLDNWLRAGTADETSFIQAHRHKVSLTSLLGRIGLTPDDLGHHPALARSAPDQPLPVEVVEAWDALLVDPDIHQLIATRSRIRHDLIVNYVAGLGLTSGHAALVDVGWRGRLAWAMSPILEEVTGFPPIHFHFGSSEVLPDADEAVDIRRFAFAPGREHPVRNPVACVETITASGRARVVGYQRTPTGAVEPVFDRQVDQIDNDDRRQLWNGALATARHLPSRATLDELGLDPTSLAPEAMDVLSHWWNRPDADEVDAMGALAFEADDDGQSVHPVVTPYTVRELTSDHRLPRLWQQGSAKASPWGLGLAARLGWRLRRVRNRTRLGMTGPIALDFAGEGSAIFIAAAAAFVGH